MEKCLTKRTLRQLSRRAGYNNKLSPATRDVCRQLFTSYMSGLIGDAVLYSQATPHARTLKLIHVLMSLKRRGITLCGIETKKNILKKKSVSK